ncbi:MAG TPA: hypothetical protein VNG32_05490, partial [Candidatus Dormibacteraeota bacterium]|nr:hypothetical protein [Candidatus Dormibacteraeota bacterium]
MKNHSTKNLRGELESAGATTSEIDELIAVASNINKLKSSKNLAVKPSIKRRRQINWKGLVPVGVTSLSGLALGMALVILSQTVLPGSLLYPVQKFSDTIAISLNTNYRGTVMMKRAQEVKQLIAKHANSNLVLAT